MFDAVVQNGQLPIGLAYKAIYDLTSHVRVASANQIASEVMKIKKLIATGIGPANDCHFDFFDDINVVTGLNGSGKTTLLKLLWYIISANVERITPEISYNEITLETNLYTVYLKREKNIVAWQFTRSDNASARGTFDTLAPPHPQAEVERLNKLIIETKTKSLFFPTFRRIEGGYSMTGKTTLRTELLTEEWTLHTDQSTIQTELQRLSQRVSVQEHRFICSISTDDIISLLTSQYAMASGAVNESYRRLSADIINKVRGVEAGKADKEAALSILEEIKTAAEEVNSKREKILKPFGVLSELATQIFRHKGIKVKSVTLGKEAQAIDSSSLSAGEKQMLSFLCYNAFYSDSVIFIDEPELSLHPDWQRKLFSNPSRATGSQSICNRHSLSIHLL